MTEIRSRTGVEQRPMAGTQYPLIGPDSPALDALADMQLGYRPDWFALPFRLVRLDGFGPSGSTNPRVVIKDALDLVVFDTASATLKGSRVWNDNFTIFRWEQNGHPLVVVRVDTGADGRPDTMLLASTLIDPMACLPTLPGVERLELFRGNATEPEATAEGRTLKLAEGYNAGILLGEEPQRTGSGARLARGVTYRFEAGAGAGLAKNCDEDPRIATINQMPPDAVGNFSAGADGCFRIEPAVEFIGGAARIIDGRLNISDDCEACCDCDDYLPVYQAMKRMRRRFASAAEVLTATRDKYHEVREEVMGRISCAKAGILRIAASPAANCELAVGVGVCNPAGEQLNGARLRLEILGVNSDGVTAAPARVFGIPTQALIYRHNEPIATTRLEYDPSMLDEGGTTTSEPGVSNSGVIDVDLGCVSGGETKSAVWRVKHSLVGQAQICVSLLTAAVSPWGEPPKICRRINLDCQADAYATTTTSTTTATTTTTSTTTTSTTTAP